MIWKKDPAVLEMSNISEITKATRRLSYNQKSIIRSLVEPGTSIPVNLRNQRSSIKSLHNRGLVCVNDGYISLSDLGEEVLKYWQDLIKEASNYRRRA
jgi:predicted transcriptional regulator